MATNFNVSPYFDDYFATTGGLSKNYYKVLFQPGRALQARELTTAQTILQNQIGALGKRFFPEGASVYGSEKFLHNPLDYVVLNSTLTDGSSLASNGESFTGFSAGDTIKNNDGVKAIINFVSPAEGSDSNMIFVKYISSSNTNNFVAGDSLYLADDETNTEIAVVGSVNSTSAAHAVTIGAGIIFTKDLFVQTDSQSIILNKTSAFSNSRIGYVVIDDIITASEDSSLKDNAQGYTNYTAYGADRQQTRLMLCSIGYTDNWVSTEVSAWQPGAVYHKNKKIKLTTNSTEVFVCVQSHTSTISNKPTTKTDSAYWVQATNFIEIGRTVYGSWSSSKLGSPEPEVGFSQSTYDTILKLIEKRTADINGDFTIKPFGLTVKENDTAGLRIANLFANNETIPNESELLVSVDFGHAYKEGHEVVTQLPENFVVAKTRNDAHVKSLENFTPDVNYGNYMVVNNASGYFDFGHHEVVSLYSANTSVTGWSNTSHYIGTAKIRYYDIDSGRKHQDDVYRAYLYDYMSTKAGEVKAIKGAYGQADTVPVIVSKNILDGNNEVRLLTTEEFGTLYETSNINKAVFEIKPGYVKTVGTQNSSLEPIFYTLKDVSARLVKGTGNIGNTSISIYSLYHATEDRLLNESDFGSSISSGGIIDPDNKVISAENNYTIFNTTGSSITMYNGNNPVTIADGKTLIEDYIAGEAGCNFSWVGSVNPDLDIHFRTAAGAASSVNVLLRIKVGVTSAQVDKKYYIPGVTTKVLYAANTSNQGYDSREISLFESDIYALESVYETSIVTPTSATRTTTGIDFVVNAHGLNANTSLHIFNGVYNVEAKVTNVTSNNEFSVTFTSSANTAISGSITYCNTNLPAAKLNLVSGTFLLGEFIKEVSAASNYIETGVRAKVISSSVANTYNLVVADGSVEGNYLTVDKYVVGESSGAIAQIKKFNLNSGVKDITGRYELDNGHKDNYCDWGKIVLKPKKTTPSNPLIVVYSKFNTDYVDTEKSFYSVDSYGSWTGETFVGNVPSGSGYVGLTYTELPVYKSLKYGSLRLRDSIDFRPVRSANNSVVSSGDLSNGILSTIPFTNFTWIGSGLKIINPSPFQSDKFQIDYSYFVDRKVSVVLNKNYQFECVNGVPGSSADPVLSEKSMLLWKLYLPPYLDNITDVQKTYIDNKSYTMKNIGDLDRRLTELEQTVKLNTEELRALAHHEPSLSELYVGLERFKNGILLDTFTGHKVGDVQNPDYRCSVEPETQTLRPAFESNVIDLDIIANSSDVKVHSVGSTSYSSNSSIITTNDSIVTLPYSQVAYIKQEDFSQSISVNPYNVTKFVGKMALTPSGDNWVDTTTLPDQNIDLTGNADAWNALASSVNARLVINCNATPAFKIGSQVTSASGGTGTVSEIEVENNNVVLIDFEGKFSIGLTISGVNDAGSTVTYSVVDSWDRGGAPGFGSQFGDWQTTWTGVDVSSQVTTTGVGRTVNDTQVTRSTDLRTGAVTITSNAVQRTQSGTTTTTRTTTNITNSQSEISSRNTLSTQVVDTDFGEKVVDIAIVPYIREKEVLFDAKGLKPNTVHYAFFNGVNVSQYCAPRTISSQVWQLGDYGTQMTSDAGGNIYGIFKIPGGVFATGERTFRLIDASTNDLSISNTYAEASYTASGLKQTKVDQIVSTRTPVLERRSTELERKVTTSTTGVTSTTSWNDLPSLATINTSFTSAAPIVWPMFMWYDPLAQSFLVDPNLNPLGIFTTAIDIFISGKPASNPLPLTLEVRTMVNGYPSQYVVPGAIATNNYNEEVTNVAFTVVGGTRLEFTTKYKHKLINGQKITILNDSVYGGVFSAIVDETKPFAFQIEVEANLGAPDSDITYTKINIAATSNNWAATKFVFDYPIYLAGGEYSFVLKSDTDEYECYITEMGKVSLKTNETITKQPYLGSMFKSQNATTWNASQENDIAFVIWRASFDTTKTGLVSFTQNDDTLNFSDNFDMKYNVINLQTGTLGLKKTSVDWTLKTTNRNGAIDSDSSAISIIPGSDTEYTNTRLVVKGQQSILVKATMSTLDETITPFIDLLNQRVIVVENVVDGYATGEYLTKGGSAQAKYISRSVVLDEGMDAIDLKVYFNASRTRANEWFWQNGSYVNALSSSEIQCYARIKAGADAIDFDSKYWIPMVEINPTDYSSTADDFRKYGYKLPKNAWIVQKSTDETALFVTGDGQTFTSGTSVFLTDYNESDMGIFLASNYIPLEHISYDEVTESITYTKFSGATYGTMAGNVSAYKTATYTDFKQYAVKLVMLSTNKGTVPMIKELKALALT